MCVYVYIVFAMCPNSPKIDYAIHPLLLTQSGLPSGAAVHEPVKTGSFMPGHAHQGQTMPDKVMPPPLVVPQQPVATPCRGRRVNKRRPQTPKAQPSHADGAATPTVKSSSASDGVEREKVPPPSPAPSVASTTSQKSSIYDDGTYWKKLVCL